MENFKGLIQQLRAMSAAATPNAWDTDEGRALKLEVLLKIRNNIDTLLDALDSLMAKAEAAEKLSAAIEKWWVGSISNIQLFEAYEAYQQAGEET